ncbi:MAG: hypothetical protein WC874_00735, partial [Candidatus Izemoplasmatales bacterium]
MSNNDELFEEESFTSQKIDFKVWKKILSFMLPLKKQILIAIVSMSLLASTDVIYPLFSKYAVDYILRPGLNDTVNPNYDNIGYFVLFYVLYIIFSAIMVYL